MSASACVMVCQTFLSVVSVWVCECMCKCMCVCVYECVGGCVSVCVCDCVTVLGRVVCQVVFSLFDLLLGLAPEQIG